MAIKPCKCGRQPVLSMKPGNGVFEWVKVLLCPVCDFKGQYQSTMSHKERVINEWNERV